MIQVACSGCGARLKVPDEKAGSRGRCPKCKAVVEIPKVEVEAAVGAEEEAEAAPARPLRAVRPRAGTATAPRSLHRPRMGAHPAGAADRPIAPVRPRSGRRAAAPPKKKSPLVVILVVVGAVVVLGIGGAVAWFMRSDEYAVARRTQGFCEALKKEQTAKLADFFPQRTPEEKLAAPLGAAFMGAFVQAAGGLEAYKIQGVSVDGDRATTRVTLVLKNGKSNADTMTWQKIDGEWYLDLDAARGGKPK